MTVKKKNEKYYDVKKICACALNESCRILYRVLYLRRKKFVDSEK